MALSLVTINKIHTGKIRPSDMELFDLVALVTQKHAQYTLNSLKDVDADSLAESYKNKIVPLSKRAVSNDSDVFQRITRNIVIHLGNFLNEADLVFNTEFWETQVENNIPVVFELVAEITDAERQAYNALPRK